MRIHVRILDNLKANGALRLADSQHTLDLPEKTIRDLIDRGLIEALDTSGAAPASGTLQPVSESGTRQGSGSAESLPSVESSAGDASGTNPNTSSDTSSGTGTSGTAGAPAAPEAAAPAPKPEAKVEFPPAGGKPKPVKATKSKKALK